MPVVVYTAAIFASALLLFLVQPMVGKLLLPLAGGAPAVWNTCMLFFQAALLAGYAYAHLSARLAVRAQAVLHLALLVGVGVYLAVLAGGSPLTLSPAAELRLGTAADPVGPLLLVLAGTVGLPFFALSATAPMLQRWFAHTGHPSARDPYFLYAASNAGSLLALLAYPFLLEPVLPLTAQGRLWAGGFALFAGLALVSALFTGRVAPPGEVEAAAPPEPLTALRRARWVLLAAVPSSLLIGVTTFVTTDIAPVPLLWVVPLALYLVTFIAAFAGRPLVPANLLGAAVALAVLVTLVTLALHASKPVWLLLFLHLGTFFLCALALHTELAADRPGPGRLTEFYLWLSVGGVVGGLLNALVAPLVLRHQGLLEYPLALTLAAALRPVRPVGPRWHWIDLVGPATLAALAVTLISKGDALLEGLQGALGRFGVNAQALDGAVARNALLVGVPAVLAYLLAVRGPGYGLALLAVYAAGEFTPGQYAGEKARERNFFGVVRVYDSGDVRRLVHGSTAHGLMGLYAIDAEGKPTGLADDDGRWLPLSYYHPTGPIGRVFRDHINAAPDGRRVAAVGLGTGSLAYYAQPGQDWTFYEIDPAVEDISCTQGLFQYWEQCRLADGPAGGPGKRVVLGDARVRLKEADDGAFDLIVLDAFSSDAIPVHLLTREAVELYTRKLRPGGLLAFHISNRYLELKPVLARHAADLNLSALSWYDTNTDDRPGKYSSDWVLLARSAADFGKLGKKPTIWDEVKPDPRGALWTDDFSNVWAVFVWGFTLPKWLGGGD